jgi:hypothetical protein
MCAAVGGGLNQTSQPDRRFGQSQDKSAGGSPPARLADPVIDQEPGGSGAVEGRAG